VKSNKIAENGHNRYPNNHASYWPRPDCPDKAGLPLIARRLKSIFKLKGHPWRD
jgi:hypothetical protein